MSVNNKKSKKAVQNAPVRRKDTAKTDKSKKKIVIAAIVAVSVIVLFIAGLFAFINNTRVFDYMDADLSKYITLSAEDYKGLSLNLNFDEIGEDDVQRKINKLLCQNKNEKPLYDGASVINMPITLGDVVKIYYRGYSIDENGNEVEIESGSNLFGDIYELEIGSGSFIPGFEEGLIGVIPKNYPRSVDKITSGKVQNGDIIYLSYDALYPDGTTASKKSERIDLSSENIDKKYGLGFKNYITGGKSLEGASISAKEIGQTISESKIFKIAESGSIVYYNLKVDYVIREDVEPLTLDVRFPSTYHNEELRGLEAKFDVYVLGVIFYDTPEYNEKFITETLKLSGEQLNAYGGNTLIEKHRAMLLEELQNEENDNRLAIYENAIWDTLHEKVIVKKLPESEVNRYYKSEYNSMASQYSSYSSVYESIDAFARAYYGLSSNANWQTHITLLANTTVTEKMMFYHIMKTEGLMPTGEDYERRYAECVNEYLEYYKDLYKEDLEDCETDEEYNERVEEIKNQMFDYYGKEFFVENVYYNAVVESLVKWVEENSKQ